MKRVPLQLLICVALVAALGASFWIGRSTASPPATASDAAPLPLAAPGSDANPTQVYAHNLLLQKGPHFRVYVRWLRGEMLRTNPRQNPSFDLPESFVLEIKKGIINVNLSDIADFLNSGAADTPLKNISITNEEGQIRLHGTAHKVVSLPVRLDGVLTPMPDGRLQYHLVKLNVLKIPMKGLLGLFHVELSDLTPKGGTPGVQISGNDIFFDTQRLLPAPHIHGPITSVTATGDSLTVVYGAAKNDEEKLARWHNFLRLTGGTLDFGKLTMRQVDLTMIDATQDPWFDLDLANYQAQLVYGTTRMTEKAGLEIYMPNVDKLPAKQNAQAVTLEWLKNRSLSPPIDVPAQ